MNRLIGIVMDIITIESSYYFVLGENPVCLVYPKICIYHIISSYIHLFQVKYSKYMEILEKIATIFRAITYLRWSN